MLFTIQNIDYTGEPNNFTLGLIDFLKLTSNKINYKELQNMDSKFTSYKATDREIVDYFIDISDEKIVNHGFTNTKKSRIVKFIQGNLKLLFIFSVIILFVTSSFADVYKYDASVRQVQLEYIQDCKESDPVSLWNNYMVYSEGLGGHFHTEYAHRYKHGYLEGGFSINELTYSRIACGALYSVLRGDSGWIYYKHKGLIKAWNSITGRVIMTDKKGNITTSYYKKNKPEWEEIPEKVTVSATAANMATEIILKRFAVTACKRVIEVIVIILLGTA